MRVGPKSVNLQVSFVSQFILKILLSFKTREKLKKWNNEYLDMLHSDLTGVDVVPQFAHTHTHTF